MAKYLIIDREEVIQNIVLGINIKRNQQGRFDLRRDLNLIFQNVPGFVTWKNIDSEYMGCNERMLHLNHVASSDDIIGKRDEEVAWSSETGAEVIRAEDAKILAGGISFVLHHYLINGVKIDMLLKKTPIIDPQDNIVGVANHAVNLIKPNMVNIISAVSQFGIKLTPAIVEKIKTYVDDSQAGVLLSTREEECLYYLIRGLSAKEIGKALNLSNRTIEFYLKGLKDKFICHKTSELIIKALEAGYLDNIPMRILVDKLSLTETHTP